MNIIHFLINPVIPHAQDKSLSHKTTKQYPAHDDEISRSSLNSNLMSARSAPLTTLYPSAELSLNISSPTNRDVSNLLPVILATWG